jgi:EmrB/QacA subfamily drug resistance transporter
MPTSIAVPEPLVIPSRIRTGPWIVLVVLTFGLFMINLDATIVQVAIPRMEAGLNTSFDQVLWVMNGYILAYAVLLITAARLGDLFGPKRLFVTGLALFTLASGACGLAQDGTELILFRLVQATGGALLTPQTLSMINTLFPPERRGAAFGVWGIAAGVSASVGPTLGGYLVTAFDWQAIFFINVPIGVLAVVAAHLLIPETRFDARHDLDLPGMLLASAGLFMGVFALVEGQRYVWGPIDTLGAVSVGPTRWSLISIYSLLVYAVFVLALFVWVERRASQPLIPFTLFRDRNFSVANVLSIAVSFAMVSMFVPVSLFAQSVLGWSALHAGLTVLPYTLLATVMAPLAGQLSDRINAKYILLAGCGLSALGIGSLVHALALDNTSWSLAGPLAIAGMGMGCTMVPMMTVAMREVAPAMSGAASGFMNTVRQVGGAIGTAVVGAVLANQVAGELPRQATRLASQIPIQARAQFLAHWQAASHSTQQFGSGQAGPVGQPKGVPPAVAEHIAAVYRETFAQAFLNGTRPAMVAVVIALGVGALIAMRLRGGRTAQEARQAAVAEPVAAAS